MLAHKLGRRQSAAGDPTQSFVSANRESQQAVAFPRHTEPLPVNAQVQRQISAHFPVVLEEPAGLGPAKIAELQDQSVANAPKYAIRGISDIKGLRHASHRTGKIGQHVSSGGLVVRAEKGNGDVIDVLHRHATRAQNGLRGHDFIGAQRPTVAPFTADFERVRAFRPTERVAEAVLRTVVETVGARIRIPFNDVFREECRDRLIGDSIQLGHNGERVLSIRARLCFLILKVIFSHVPRRPTGLLRHFVPDAEFVHDTRGQRRD